MGKVMPEGHKGCNFEEGVSHPTLNKIWKGLCPFWEKNQIFFLRWSILMHFQLYHDYLFLCTWEAHLLTYLLTYLLIHHIFEFQK